MDKLPPPNGSREEVEAWNQMMDTMVTFIKASTNLMNTISKKAVKKRKCTKIEQPSCDPKKPPCETCEAKKSKQPSLTIAIENQPPPNDAETDEQAAPSLSEDAEEATEEAAKVTNESKPLEQPKGDCQTCPDNPKDCICEKPNEKKKAEEEEISEEEDVEDVAEELCGCGPTQGNTQAMMEEMYIKLSSAQEEIMKLQDEMARLQRMDATKRLGPHGSPNPAMLYREIMKGTTPCPNLDEARYEGVSRRPQMSSPRPPNNVRGCPPCMRSAPPTQNVQMIPCPAYKGEFQQQDPNRRICSPKTDYYQ